MPFDGGATTAGEEAEALVEAARDLFRAHRRDPRGGELDRERDAVEPTADLDHGHRGGRVEGEPGFDRRGPFHEEPHGRGS